MYTIEARFAALLEQVPKSKESQRLLKRYRKQRGSLFIFLPREDMAATNNASEQALSNSVIYHKVTGAFRTSSGANIYANLISVLETARRQQPSLFATLVAVLAGQSAFLPLS